MNNYYIASPASGQDCVDLDQGYVKICLTKEDCNPSDPGGNLVRPEDQWNCNLCQTDRPFFLPIVDGDVFMFQTRFFDAANEDPENPSLGLGDWLHLEVCDADGSAVMTEAEPGLVTRDIVAHTGRTSYQLYEIDFDIITEECFSIRFYTDDNQELVTQHFTKNLRLCPETVVIRSIHAGRDNSGNYYGSPIGTYVGDLMTYDNAARVAAAIVTSEYSVQKTVIGRSRVTDVVTEDVSLLVFEDLVPPWLVRWMTKTFLSGQVINVDGREFISGNFTKGRDDPHQKMYHLEMPLIERVENSGYEC